MFEALNSLAERLGFGPEYDRTARQALRLSPSRIVAFVMFLALAPTMGWPATLTWMAVMLSLELCLCIALKRQIAGGARRFAQSAPSASAAGCGMARQTRIAAAGRTAASASERLPDRRA